MTDHIHNAVNFGDAAGLVWAIRHQYGGRITLLAGGEVVRVTVEAIQGTDPAAERAARPRITFTAIGRAQLIQCGDCGAVVTSDGASTHQRWHDDECQQAHEVLRRT
jgi:hypothetical protein